MLTNVFDFIHRNKKKEAEVAKVKAEIKCEAEKTTKALRKLNGLLYKEQIRVLNGQSSNLNAG